MDQEVGIQVERITDVCGIALSRVDCEDSASPPRALRNRLADAGFVIAGAADPDAVSKFED